MPLPFDVDVMIQGAANFVPHEHGDRLLALFPRQDTTEAMRFRSPGKVPIPPHDAFAQFLASNLDGSHPPVWMSVDLTGHWVLLEVDGNPPELDLGGGALDGLPSMHEVLEDLDLQGFAPLDPTVLPKGTGVAERLKAGVYLDAGGFGMDRRWAARVRFGRAGSGTGTTELKASNTYKLELKKVTTFTLVLRPFSGGPDMRIPLKPVADRLELWLRHICDIRPPKVPSPLPGPVEERDDGDFPLNYILRKDAAGLAKIFESVDPPVPVLIGSWESEAFFGPGWPQCLGALESPANFEAP